MLGFEGSDSEVLDRNGGYELHGPLEISIWHTMGEGMWIVGLLGGSSQDF